jgi:hypothetical protein
VAVWVVPFELIGIQLPKKYKANFNTNSHLHSMDIVIGIRDGGRGEGGCNRLSQCFVGQILLKNRAIIYCFKIDFVFPRDCVGDPSVYMLFNCQ